MIQQASVNAAIHGDARIVLPELLEGGLGGRVKLIYLDPPYNTRRSDRFPGHYRDSLATEEWADLLRDVLAGSRDLLREDGSLWLQISSRELGPAQQVCNEVLAQTNFAGLITWEKTRRPSFSHGQLASTTEHILIYGKDRQKLGRFAVGTTEAGKRTPVAHRGNRIVDVFFPSMSVQFGGPDGVYPAGDHSTPGISAQLAEDVLMQGGWNRTPLRMTLPSRYSPAKLAALLADGGEFFIPKQPFRPSYLAPGGRPKTISNLWTWQLDPDMETYEDGAKQQQALFPGRPFPYAKPEGLMRRILESATDPGDIVLDCFSGSGTLPAVAQQLGRQWIAIEQNPDTVRGYLLPRTGSMQADRPQEAARSGHS